MVFDIKDREKVEEFIKFRENIHKILWKQDEKFTDNFAKKYQTPQIMPGRLRILLNLRIYFMYI